MRRTLLILAIALLAVPALAGDVAPALINAPFTVPDQPGPNVIQRATLATFRALPGDHAGVIPANGRLVFTLERPADLVGKDSWAWSKARAEGRAWNYADAERSTGNTPDGATDSDEECESETAEMCDEAGHGPGSTNATRTQAAAEDGGGCTCMADCGDASGAVAFISSASGCG